MVDLAKDKVYVAGHRGMVGSAIVRALEAAGAKQIVMRSHRGLDLTDQAAVDAFFTDEKPDYVVIAAAKVGESMRTIPILRIFCMTI